VSHKGKGGLLLR